VRVALTDTDLARLAEDAVEAVRPLASEKGLEMRVTSGSSVVVRTDAQLVRQILWNLLGNAIKYTDAGSVEVTVDRVGDVVRISVSDTGQGMTDEQLERAFDAFIRFRPPGDSPGTGLGLAISKRLAELIGATLSATSEPGSGTTLTLEVPV
jgi:signal transduction histidine kinase